MCTLCIITIHYYLIQNDSSLFVHRKSKLYNRWKITHVLRSNCENLL